jgi:hypothetical protein
MKEKIKEEVIKIAKDGELSCPQAFGLAKSKGFDLKEIGQVCNELNIKIVGCQLGCF